MDDQLSRPASAEALEQARSGTLAASMPDEQVRWLEKRLAASRGYVEFGSGGSTIAAARLVDGPILSVESAPEWVDSLSHCPSLKARIDEGRLRIHHADVGPIFMYGYPADEPTWQMGRAYAVDPLAAMSSADAASIDTVLVDGRFRVACTVAARLVLPATPHTMVDDYADRPHYHVLADVMGEPDVVGRAAVFREPGKSPAELLRVLLDHLDDPR